MLRIISRTPGNGCRFLAAAMVLLLAASPAAESVLAQGRGKISGTVTDARTGDPLPGVNVVIDGTTLGTASDTDGDYFIANLRAGEYTVTASFIGYQSVSVQEVDVRSGGTTDIDFSMSELTLLMEDEIVVTATRPLVEKDNTTSLVLLQSDEIASRPTTVLTEVLTSLPSINVEGGQMTVRGGALNEVAFLLDGTRVGDPFDHSPYTRINLSAIQELEVITGAFNAEYGEAQSGVINVITKEGSENYDVFLDARFDPPGVRHFGTSFYDTETELYWENTHARHLDWWIEYPDQWVDSNGIPGSDPRSEWTPEEAYQNYLDTHQPLTDYDDTPTYQIEAGLGGPVPAMNNLRFFVTGKYRSEAPLLGNSFREKGEFTDATYKLSYLPWPGAKLTFSGFYGKELAGWGFYPDNFWATTFGIDSRYAYYDLPGLEEAQTDGQTLTFTHVLNQASMYEVSFSRVQATRIKGIFPGDPIGWEAADATRDNLRAVNANGTPIPGGFSNRIGYHTIGYFDRHDNSNTQWNLSGFYSNQLTKVWHLKSGGEMTLYNLDHFNQAKLPDRTDDNVYKPYQGAAYLQSKFEIGGFIMNAGVRLDLYNANEDGFTDPFNPLLSDTISSDLYAQISPRLGVSHPIDENTVLHFSFGQFFQRPPFGDNGEGNDAANGSLTTFIVDGTDTPWVLGNRDLRPRKTTSFEVGIERNFWNSFVVDVTGFYKDIRNTIRTITIETGSAVYRTNGNGDYADESGLELSVRKVPSRFFLGTWSGYANYTTRSSILGRSGDPVVVTPVGVRFAPSGDFIVPNNARFKAGLFYETPTTWNSLIGQVAKNISLSLDFRANFPNDDVRSDFFLFEGVKHIRPADITTDLRLRKEIFIGDGRTRISPYVEVTNLFNSKWLFLQAFERASFDEQRKFVESGFDYLPPVDANGRPILEFSMFRNLPRQVIWGVTIDL
ncbi:MAG TPA: TonB-dependent receptor [Rhodothermales bacterium]|nr:TonB-dependent receptor [Rhodothermales bacterium]